MKVDHGCVRIRPSPYVRISKPGDVRIFVEIKSGSSKVGRLEKTTKPLTPKQEPMSTKHANPQVAAFIDAIAEVAGDERDTSKCCG